MSARLWRERAAGCPQEGPRLRGAAQQADPCSSAAAPPSAAALAAAAVLAGVVPEVAEDEAAGKATSAAGSSGCSSAGAAAADPARHPSGDVAFAAASALVGYGSVEVRRLGLAPTSGAVSGQTLQQQRQLSQVKVLLGGLLLRTQWTSSAKEVELHRSFLLQVRQAWKEHARQLRQRGQLGRPPEEWLQPTVAAALRDALGEGASAGSVGLELQVRLPCRPRSERFSGGEIRSPVTSSVPKALVFWRQGLEAVGALAGLPRPRRRHLPRAAREAKRPQATAAPPRQRGRLPPSPAKPPRRAKATAERLRRALKAFERARRHQLKKERLKEEKARHRARWRWLMDRSRTTEELMRGPPV